MAKTQILSVDTIRIDAGTQSRISIDEEVVEDYADLIAESDGEWPFGPLDVFHDGTDYLVADGFHRTLAAQRAKRSSIPCRVHKGTVKDARIFGMTANDRHGLRMSRADKRACVEWLLDNGDKMTQAEIASKAGVSIRLVKYVVAERKAPKVQFAPLPSSKVGDQPPQGNADVSAGGEGGSSAPAGASPDASTGMESPPITAKTGREKEVWEVQQVLKGWADTVGRWMNGNPAGIDVYRERFPGKRGDRVIEAAKELFNSLDAWKKGLK